jgi:aminobenzoyl-glutamate transport protein
MAFEVPMKKSFLYRFLDRVERVGNSLPHPTLLFLLFGALVIIISAVVSAAGLSATHPVSGEVLTSVNLLSSTGLRFVLSEMVKNYTGFAPLGTVLVAMLGFSLAEKSGLLTTLLRLLVLKAPKMLLIPAILLAGVMSHSGGDIGYVLLIPLAGLTFQSAGLHLFWESIRGAPKMSHSNSFPLRRSEAYLEQEGSFFS